MVIGSAANPIPPTPDTPFGGVPVRYRGPLPSDEVRKFIKALEEKIVDEREGRLQNYNHD